jgi:hypothetical protein
MAGDMFLKIGSLTGESVDGAKNDWIDITGSSFAITNPTVQGGQQSKPTFTDISKYSDKSSMSLWNASKYCDKSSMSLWNASKYSDKSSMSLWNAGKYSDKSSMSLWNA